MNTVRTAADAITDTEADTFARYGSVCIRGLLDSNWLPRLAAIFDELKAQGTDLSNYYDSAADTPAGAKGQSIVCDDCWRLSASFLDFLKRSPLARTAAAVLGSEQVRIYEDLLIFKSAAAEQPTPWHQDEPQWPLSGRQMASGWFCLDAVTAATGALRFVDGSHQGPLYTPFVPPDRQADLAADMRFFDGGPLPDVDADPARFPVKSFDTQPGDVVFFHPRAIHAAFGSAQSHSRRTFSIRFLGDDVRWLPKKSVFHDWLRSVALSEGDRIDGERFPILWQRSPRSPRP